MLTPPTRTALFLAILVVAGITLQYCRPASPHRQRANVPECTAVVFVSGTLNACRATTLLALAHDTPVHALVGNYSVPRHVVSQLVARGVTFIDRSQLGLPVRARDGWRNYAGHSSGTSKVEFLLWLGKSNFKHAWLLEDDVLFTGAWMDFFSWYANDDADVLNYFARVGGEWIQSTKCWLADGKKCLGAGAHGNVTKLRWPVIRISRSLAVDVADALNHGARGHHEALAGTVCDLNPRCVIRQLRADHMGLFELGYWGRYRRHASLTLEEFLNRTTLARNRLYHPVKCSGEPALGLMSMSYAMG
jgi:hypothetical protein